MSGARPPLIKTRPQLKPDNRPLDNAGVRKAAAALKRAKRTQQGVTEAEEALVRECAAAQEHRDRRVRQDAMYYLMANLPPGGERVLYRAIREETHEGGVEYALYGTLQYVRKMGARIDRSTLAAIRDLATDQRNRWAVRGFAMDVLERGAGRGMKQLLVCIATNDSHDFVHEQANVALLRFGHVPAKRALLEHIRSHPEHAGYAHDLWRHRSLFRWRPSEERELRQMMDRYHAGFRRRLYDRRWRLSMRAGAVRWLIWLAEDSFGFALEDVKQGWRIARMCDKGERKQLMGMLRAFEQR